MGWKTLERTYPAILPFTGKIWRFCSGRVGGVVYAGSLRFGADKAGLYINLSVPFSIGHAPLSIPWQDVLVSLKKWMFFEWWEFEFTQAPNVSISVGKKLGQRLIHASTGR